MLSRLSLVVCLGLFATDQEPPPATPRQDAPAPGGRARPELGAPAARILARPGDEHAALARSLDELRAAPLHSLGRRVEFTLQIAPPAPAPDPLWTRFSSATWRAVPAWGEAQFPWRRDHFEDPARHVFVRRGSAEEVLLANARPYERFVVTATLREVALGAPWLELHTARRADVSMAEGTVLHAARALELAAAKQFELALEQLERALAAPMPGNARAELERLRGEWRAPPPGR